MIDETMEETPAESSTATTEDSTDETSTDEVTDETKDKKTVPYDRFKQVNDKLKDANELLAIHNQETQSTVNATEKTQAETIDYDAQDLKAIEDTAKSVAQTEVNKVASRLRNEISLQQMMIAHSDYKELMPQLKEIRTENPTISWERVYQLAKFPMLETKLAEKATKVESDSAKEAASVETGAKAKSVGKSATIDPMAKNPDGSYVYSTKELESVLPHN